MSKNSKQIQGQNLQLTQTLAPHQVLVARILELPVVELEDRVRAELLENPALEEGEETPIDNEDVLSNDGYEANSYDESADYRSEDDIPDYRMQHPSAASLPPEDIPYAEATSFYDTLKEQVGERAFTKLQRLLAHYLIGSLDDDGLLRKPLSEICEELYLYRNIIVTEQQLEEVLFILQGFEPAGIGARNLQECLLLQIRRQANQPDASPLLQVEEEIISRYYDEFTRKSWDKIIASLKYPDETTRQAIAEICKLNPRPGASLGEVAGRNMQQIVPDVLVETNDDGTIIISLNNLNIPPLQLNNNFIAMARENNSAGNNEKSAAEAQLFLREKLESAQSFIAAYQIRQQALLSTMQVIVELQRPFFLEGDEQLLQPLLMKKVSELTGYDQSTISRIATGKYVQTNYGIYPLRFFFSESYAYEEGKEIALRDIRRAVQQLIEQEDKQKPYNDDELTELLNKQGYPLARRTVTKYRKQLGIPTAKMRSALPPDIINP